MSVAADAVAEMLQAHDVRATTGVPCSYLDPLFHALSRCGLQHVGAGIEGEAVAFAVGSWLAGRREAVLLQSSGLGHVVNPLATLAIPYRIPVVLVVSWRGVPGSNDALHQHPMGEATLPILEALKVRYVVVREPRDVDEAREAVGHALEARSPVAVVIPRGCLDGARPPMTDPAVSSFQDAPVERFEGGGPLTRPRALEALTAAVSESGWVSTTGFVSRELAHGFDRPGNFYMQGSMGFASSVGLSVARHGRIPVTVFDGDGAALMHLGGLAAVGASAPPGLVHVVLDDGSYASTGGQMRPAPQLDFAAVAAASGYREAATCEGETGLSHACAWLAESGKKGPAFLRVRVVAESAKPAGRPVRTPPEIADRFRAWVRGMQVEAEASLA